MYLATPLESFWICIQYAIYNITSVAVTSTRIYVLCTYVGIKDVILPPKLKKRGRPKGAEKTVIGLPAKKRKAKLVIPFLKKLPAEKEKGTIS